MRVSESRPHRPSWRLKMPIDVGILGLRRMLRLVMMKNFVPYLQGPSAVLNYEFILVG